MNFAACVLAVLAGISADPSGEIVMRNGESREGRILVLDRAGAVIAGFAGEQVRIPWIDVADARSKEPVRVRLINGDRVTLTVRSVKDGIIEGELAVGGTVRLAITSLEDPRPVPADAPPGTLVGEDPDAVPQEAKQTTPLKPGPWKGKVALSATEHVATVNSALVALHAEGSRQWEEDKVQAAIDALYGRSSGKTTNKSFGAKLRYDHFFTNDVYGYGSAEAFHDDVQHLNLRGILSAGVGDMLWKESDDKNWSVEGGLSALYEKFSTLPGARLSPAARVATTYKDVFFTNLHFQQGFEFLLPLDAINRYIAHAQTVLSVPVCDAISLRATLDVTYQNAPPAGTKNLDLVALLGLEYSF